MIKASKAKVPVRGQTDKVAIGVKSSHTNPLETKINQAQQEKLLAGKPEGSGSMEEKRGTA